LRLVDERSMGCDVAPSERDAEKEPQRRHGDVMRAGADAASSEMQLEEPDVLEARRVGRPSQEIGEALDGADVALLGFGRQVADRHNFDHALAQWADGLVDHGVAPVSHEVANPMILRQDWTSRYAGLQCASCEHSPG